MAANSEFDDSQREGIGLLEEETDADADDSRYGVAMAAIFAVGVIAGTGILVLPNAVAKTGWSGLLVLIALAVIQTYTGIILGRCWTILQERFEKYNRQTRYPYAAIGYEAFGNIGRVLVTVTINLSILGILVAFLLIISENVTILLNIHDFNNCYMLLIIAAVLSPMLWLGTPKDFWPFAVLATVSTGLASLLLVIAILRESPQYHGHAVTSFIEPSLVDYFAGVGVMIVAYNGHPAYPVLQHDMKTPSKFPWSLMLAGCVATAYFLPMTIAGYYTHGSELIAKANIFEIIDEGVDKTLSLLLITLHVVMAFVIFGNPIFQEAEELTGIDTHFSWQRVLVRSLLLLFIVFVAASVPFFATVLSLLGGTTLLASTLIYPVCCYWKLRETSSEDKRWETKKLSTLEKVIFTGILLLGAVIAVLTTYSNVIGFEKDFELAKPCYLS